MVATVLSPASGSSPFSSLKGPRETFPRQTRHPLLPEEISLRAHRHTHRQTGPDPGLSGNINHHRRCGGPRDRLSVDTDRAFYPSVLVPRLEKQHSHTCSEGRRLIMTRINSHCTERSMKTCFDKWILKTASLDYLDSKLIFGGEGKAGL